MLDLILFISFLIYVFLVFAINDFIIQTIFLIINIALMLLLKISIKKANKNILFLFPFILITSIINLLLGKPLEAILVTLKLIIVCNITYIFKTSFGTTRIIKTIEVLFSPLKIFRINSQDISLIINIAIIFIPNIIQELNQLKSLFLSKGCNPHHIKSIKYISKILLITIFKKTNEMELALKAKGFSE